MRKYAYTIVTTIVVLVFAALEWLVEKNIADHSRIAGAAVELAIVLVAALAFRPIHRRVEGAVEAAFTKRRREALAALAALRAELTSFNDVRQLLRRLIESIDRNLHTAGSAVYLRRTIYVAEASTFDLPAPGIAVDDVLVVRLRSSSHATNPKAIGSSAPGAMALPIMLGGDLFGFLTTTRQSKTFEREELAGLVALLEATAVALAGLDPTSQRSASAARTNLPAQITAFVGRDEALNAIVALLGDRRLVTLVGTGGVGKTRAGLEAASAVLDLFVEEVWLVELATVAPNSTLADAVVRALKIVQPGNVAALDAIIAFLRSKPCLLILDNCEHLIGEVRQLASALLRRCGALRILVTTREPLNITGEHVYRIPSLGTPINGEDANAQQVGNYAAAQLFVERARACDSAFELTDENAADVARICRRLDGIPLAIELAAARTKILAPADLVRELDDRFRILTGGDSTALARHQTMRGLIDWSYDLLSEAERSLLRRLSVCAGFTRESAVAIWADPASGVPLFFSLLDKSLIQKEQTHGGVRYRLLESVRAYAYEKLTGEAESAARSHAAAYCALAQDLAHDDESTPDMLWLMRAAPEMENWQTALEWTLSACNDVPLGQQLAAALSLVWVRIAPQEGRRWTEAALNDPSGVSPALSAELCLSQARLDTMFNRFKESGAWAQRALEEFQVLGDRLGAAHARRLLGVSLVMQHRIEPGERFLNEVAAAAKALDAGKLYAATLNNLAWARQFSDDFETARTYYAEALVVAKECGADRTRLNVCANLAELEFNRGDAQTAIALLEEALKGHQTQNDTLNVARTRCNLAAYQTSIGRYDNARVLARDALPVVRDMKSHVYVLFALQRLAAVAAFRQNEDLILATRLMGYVDVELRRIEALREYPELVEYEAVMNKARGKLGEAEVIRLLESGAQWTEEKAAESALLA